MTTIAIDGKRIACDSQMNIGPGLIEPHEFQKIIIENNFLFAWCGNANYFAPVIDWYMKDKNPEKMPGMNNRHDFTLWVYEKATKKLMEITKECPYPMPISMPNAMGSGSPYAFAALELGHSAYEAVQVAIKLDNESGGRIWEHSLEYI